MNVQQLLLSICIAFFSCDEGVSTVNLTLYLQEMSWKDASYFCSQHNGVLESNTTLVINQLEKEGSHIQNVWFGKYKAYSQWAYIQGCFFINGHIKHFTEGYLEELDCQKMCETYRFYTIKATDCYCMDSVSSFKRSNTCNCSGCFKIWEHQLHDFDRVNYDTQPECIAATECRSGTIRRRYDPCTLNHNVTCDNNVNLGFSSYSQQDASSKCQKQGSFIKWFPDDFCTPGISLPHPFWTGGRRQKHIFHQRKYYDIDNVQLIKCYNIHRDDGNLKEEHEEDCNKSYPFVCRFDPDTGETDNQSSGMIIGIVISISVIVLTLLVILVFVYRRQYKKEQLSLNTDYRRDHHTHDMDNYALNSDYQELNNVQEKLKPYDQLQVSRNHGNVDTELTTEQTNTSFSRDEYSNTDILEYEHLDNSDKYTSTHAYDQLNVTRIVKTDSTNFFSNTTVSKEKYSKNESTKATAITLESEQLDNAKRDKSLNVYDQLHVTDMIDNEQNNYNSMILRDQQHEQEETTNLNHMTVTSEYEQLDSAKKDKSVNVYDQLDVANVLSNDPTLHNPCQ